MTTVEKAQLFISTIVPPLPIHSIKEKPKKCCFDGCKKKLTLTDFPCKCGNIHCHVHRPSEVHNCTYDFKKDQRTLLLKSMDVPIVANKVDKI